MGNKDTLLKVANLKYNSIFQSNLGVDTVWKKSPEVVCSKTEETFLNDFKCGYCHFDFAIDISYLYAGSSNFTILLKSLENNR